MRAAAAGSKLKGSDKSPRDLPPLDKPGEISVPTRVCADILDDG